MAQVFNKRWAGLVIYILAITGTTLLAARLSTLVMVQAMALARPYLQSSPPKLSLIQQRRLDAALALPPSPSQDTTFIVATEVPPVRPGILAAQLDLAEKGDLAPAFSEVAAYELQADPSSIATEPRKLRVAHSGPRSSLLTTRDIFNRSFGVLTAAAD